LVASVIDIFERHDTRIAILDTSVNHLPEVLEFGYQPEVEGSTVDGDHEYVLAGGSCLAGDTFGRYRFDAPLSIGTTITFIEAGAYAQAKSHRFNGINLPAVWIASPDGSLTERQMLDYASYLEHWMPNA
jgi:carboxynorspermidine decarboxylase